MMTSVSRPVVGTGGQQVPWDCSAFNHTQLPLAMLTSPWLGWSALCSRRLQIYGTHLSRLLALPRAGSARQSGRAFPQSRNGASEAFSTAAWSWLVKGP